MEAPSAIMGSCGALQLPGESDHVPGAPANDAGALAGRLCRIRRPFASDGRHGLGCGVAEVVAARDRNEPGGAGHEGSETW